MEFERSAKRDFSRIGAAFIAMLAVTMVVQMIISTIIGFSGIELPNWASMVASLLPLYLIGVPVCYGIIKKVPAARKADAEKWGIGKVLLCFVMAVGLMYFGNIISQLIMGLINAFRENPSTNPIENMVMDSTMVVTIIFVVILAPVIEELLFRKLLIDRVNVYGEGTAVLVSGVMFGLFHGNLYQVIYASLLGFLFAYIYVKTGKVGYTIGLHVAVNFMGSVLAPALLNGIDMDHLNTTDPAQLMEGFTQLLPLMFYALFMIGCMIATIVLLICLRKKIVFRPGSIRILRGQRFAAVVLNVGMILFILGCVAMFIMNLT